MSTTTTYYAFTALYGENVALNDYANTYWNWLNLDNILQSFATHQHNNEAVIDTPAGSISAVNATSGGTLPSGATYYFAITFVDTYQRETAKSEVTYVTTENPISAPAIPTYVAATDLVAYGSGLTGNSYWYKLTYTKGGGETIASAPLHVSVPSNQRYKVTIHFDDIDTVGNNADSIIVYRKAGINGAYGKIAELEYSATPINEFTDDGSYTADTSITAPDYNTTNSENAITIDWSNITNYDEAEYIKIYCSYVSNVWTNPIMLVATIDITMATPPTSYEWTGTSLSAGKPPLVTALFSNPDFIDLTSEVKNQLPWGNLPTDLTWKPSVATSASLPASSNTDGDVRMAMDTYELYVWDDSLSTPAWVLVDGASITSDGNLVFPKAQGYGIKVDLDTPTFPWMDMIGQIDRREIVTDPEFVQYSSTNFRQYQFSEGDEVWVNFHIPHDYVPGSDLYIHVHWSHNASTVTGGTVTWGLDYTYAKGHDQDAFDSEINTSMSPSASTTQYKHLISEIQMSAAEPGATPTMLDSDDIEVDGVIIVHLILDSNDITVSGGGVPDPFVHQIDIHYQSTGIGTKGKTGPNFWS